MRSLLPACLLLAMAISGCLEDSTGGTKASATTGNANRFQADNSTIHGKLTNSPHVNINSGMTLAWDLPNASRDAPGIATTLVQFLDTYKSSHHSFDGNFHVVAFIPVEAREAGSCGPQEKEIKTFLRYRDTGNNNRFGGLTGDYAKGWYHAVLIAFERASFSISFDSEKAARPRTLPPADPFVAAGAASLSGARELSHAVPAAEGTWLAWASAQVQGNNVDGGRSHKLDVGCQSTTLNRQPGQGGFNQNNVVTASAIGPDGGFEIKSQYTPTLSATASTATTLNAAWVRLSTIPLEAAPSTDASKAP